MYLNFITKKLKKGALSYKYFTFLQPKEGCKYRLNLFPRVFLFYKSVKYRALEYFDILELSLTERRNGISLIFLLLFCAIFFYLLYFVLFRDDYLAHDNKLSHSQKARPIIVDANGTILAQDIIAYDLYFKPCKVSSVKDELRKISRILPSIKSKYSDIFAKILERSGSCGNILIQMGISQEDKINLLDSGVTGLEFETKQFRYYFHNNLASHVLGFTSDDGIGMSGIERFIDRNDLKNEGSVFLGLDIRAQTILHNKLEESRKSYNAIGASGMIARIKTGEIIAAVSLPDYNPNKKSTITYNNMFNRFSLGVYELGSVFKILNIAIAIESGLDRNKQYNVSDDIVMNNYTITDMRKIRKTMTLEESLIYSSNIASGKILLDFGKAKQIEFFNMMKMGEKMNYEIQEIGKPIYPSAKTWTDLKAITMSYGHGIATTQANFIRGMCTILNDGQFTDLTFLKNSNNGNGYKVFSSKTSKDVLSIMQNTVLFGAAKKVKSSFYDIGGKGGTSIKIRPEGGYDRSKNFVSFVATFPLFQPEYVMIISLDEPVQGNINRLAFTGGSILGPVAKDIIEGVAFQLHIKMTDKIA